MRQDLLKCLPAQTILQARGALAEFARQRPPTDLGPQLYALALLGPSAKWEKNAADAAIFSPPSQELHVCALSNSTAVKKLTIFTKPRWRPCLSKINASIPCLFPLGLVLR
jgi:hypothetical protein